MCPHGGRGPAMMSRPGPPCRTQPEGDVEVARPPITLPSTSPGGVLARNQAGGPGRSENDTGRSTLAPRTTVDGTDTWLEQSPSSPRIGSCDFSS
eukprot:scaffold3577_cov414-Prasinococcus_capsulatus_cf.AAC.1